MNWHDYFRYEDGKLYWINAPKRKPFLAGAEAGSLNGNGYRAVKIDGKRFMCHRIIYEMLIGEIPEGMVIDHINGNKLDNDISNLRVASVSLNARNCRMNSKNKSGFNGVSFYPRTGRYVAFSRSHGKHVHIGYFETMEDACNARLTYDMKNEFTERHGKNVNTKS